MEQDFSRYLQCTTLVNCDHPEVIAYARAKAGDTNDKVHQAVNLYYAVRDDFRYDPYHVDLSEEAMKASAVLKRGSGYCVEKANLLGACARVMGIPSRFGFADVRNHLSTEKFVQMLGTDVFAFHGYTEMFLDGKWVKATPAFNKGLCERMNVNPLEFNGREDSIFHEYNGGTKFMEYIYDHGVFDDIPREYFIETLKKHYPHLFTPEAAAQMTDEYFFKL